MRIDLTDSARQWLADHGGQISLAPPPRSGG